MENNLKKSVKELLLSDNFWVLNKRLVYRLGLETAFFLSSLAEGEKMLADKDGWFYQTHGTVEEKTTLSRHKQDICIEQLEALDLIEKDVRGMPGKRHFRIKHDNLAIYMFSDPAEYEKDLQARLRNIDNQGCEKSADRLRNIDNQDCKKSATINKVPYKELNNKENNNKGLPVKPDNAIKETKPLKFEEGSVEIRVAQKMIDIILEVKPDSKVPGKTAKDLQGWGQDIDYMIRLDKRSPQDIVNLFWWVQNDDFWVANVRSPRKLRKQWDRLELQRQRDLKVKRPQNKNLDNLARMYQTEVEKENGDGGLFG